MIKRLVAAILVLLPLAASSIELTSPVLAPAAYSAGEAVIASNGRTFLRLFRMNGQTYASMAGADGRTTTPKPALLGKVPIVRLAWTGSDYAGVISDGRVVRLLRFVEDGTLLADRVLPFTLNNVKLASNGSNLLLTGVDPGVPIAFGHLEGHLLTREGAVLSDLGPLAPSAIGSYAVTSSGDDYFLAYKPVIAGVTIKRLRGGTIASIYTDSRPVNTLFDIAARSDGVVMLTFPPGGPWELAFIANNSVVRRETVFTSRRLMTTASGYAVVQQVPGLNPASTIERFDANGQRLDASALHVIPGYFNDAATAGDLVQILANDFGTVASKLSATTITTTPPALNPLEEVISILPKRQIRPAVASDGIRFLGAFNELTADSSVASFARFTRTGPLDGPGIALGDSASYSGPVIVTAPGGYLGVWSTSQALMGAFITSGGVAGAPFLVAATWAADPALAWSGTNFLAVWSMNGRIYATTIFLSGSVGAVQKISDDPGPNSADYYLTPDVAWDGTHFVVAWLVHRQPSVCTLGCGPLPANGILVEHVTADGRPVEPLPLAAIVSSERPIDHAQIASAGNGTALLAIDRSNRLETALVRGASVDPPRALFDWLGASALFVMPSLRSDIAFDGTSYVIGWRFGDAWRSFIATAHIAASGSGVPFESRAAVIGPVEGYASFDVALATISPEESAVVVSEVATPGDASRAHAYFTTEMNATPPPPAAPHDVAAVYFDGVLSVTWAAGPDAQGFAIQDAANGSPLGFAPEGTTRATISPLFRGAVQVRGYNGGGIGNPSPAAPVIVHTTRRRAAKKN